MDDPLAPLIRSLHGEGRVRVWSVVITIFGDVVHHRGGSITMGRLQSLIERLGIEPGALRTALSRLARDGWVVRSRNGRNSTYRLSPMGLQEFGPAMARVYTPPSEAPVEHWILACGRKHPSAEALQVGEGVWLLPCTGGAGEAPDVSGLLAVSGALKSLPEDFRERMVLPAHRSAIEALASDVACALAMARDNPAPLDALAARVMIIHRWRRIVLKYPDIPVEILPPGVPDARRLVADAYHALLPVSEKWLDGPQCDHAPLLEADKDLFRRFRKGYMAPDVRR